MVDKKMHNGLGYLIGYGLPHNVEVRRNQSADQFCLQQFSVGESGLRIVVQLEIKEN